MQAIGGYFELADYEEGKGFPHQNGILLNTGRNALEFILRSIGEVKRIYLPYYTCEVVLEPIKKLHIPYTFYHINLHLEIVEDLKLEKDEYIIANNYFGLKDAYIQHLAERYGHHLIVDCAQAFFAKPVPEMKAFYSPRKFVGVADGGVAYLGGLSNEVLEVNEIDCSDDHNSHLNKRKQFGAEAGFTDYQANEKKLDNQPIRKMSDDTKRNLDHIDYEKVIAKRRGNFVYLHKNLREKNLLQLPRMGDFACPMVYPFMARTNMELRKELINNKIFVAKYWPNILQLGDYELEYDFATLMIPIPCDQRYGEEEMNRINEIIHSV